ncbi:MAG TPA: tyrosine--tRNA ligase [Armatimonadota bacterium]
MTPEQQLQVLTHGAVDVVNEEELLAKLRLGRPLRIKYGADPSAPDLHLGHSVPLRRLRKFQELGHQIVFIIGDFTGRIGDPSGRSKTRPMLTEEQIQANAATYAAQVGRILDVSRCEIHYNSDWFSKKSAADLLALASHYTIARMLERDDFDLRFKSGVAISLLEMMYPLVQAYDSAEVRADVEIGGTDQLFNFLVGRDIMRAFQQEPQIVLTWPLLVGLDGVEKMSKSLGNYVGISEPPGEIFGKLMSIPDAAMPSYYRLLLDYDEAQVAELQTDLASGALHPREAKAHLAEAITAEYCGAEAGVQARAEFDQVFSRRETPTTPAMMDVWSIPKSKAEGISVVELIRLVGFAPSNSEARRLVRQKAVRLNGVVIDDENAILTLKTQDVLHVGKRRFAGIMVVED